ncbi:MAG: exo-alpha-sialidase, partial [Bacteroidetes bacterium]|nr:exo-alpha-sialidase [Bacteroidota bacterium]
MNRWNDHPHFSILLSTVLLFTFLLSPFPLSAQYTQIFDPTIAPIEKMLVFDDTLYGIPGYSSGSPDPLLFSTDLGANWRSYRSPLDWLDIEVTDIAASNTHMYVLTDRGLFRKSLMEGAFRWATRVTGTAVFPSGGEVHILDGTTDTTVFYHSFAFGRDPQPYAHPERKPTLMLAEDSLLWITGGNTTWFSSDRGASWAKHRPSAAIPITDMARYDGALYGVPRDTAPYLLRSEDRRYWDYFDLPFSVNNSVRIAAQEGRLYLWSEWLGAVRYESATGGWTNVAGPLPGITSFHAIDGVHLAIASGSVYRFDETERNWRLQSFRYLTRWRTMVPIATKYSLFVRGSETPTVGRRFGGNTWWNVPLHRYQYLSNIIDVGGTLYDSHDSTMWRSTDDGLHWEWHKTLPRKTGKLVTDGSRLVTLTRHTPPDSAYVMHSDDFGDTWVRESGFLDDQGTRGFFARDDRRLVVTRQNGPIDRWFHSPDAGRNWIELNLSLLAPVEHVVLGESRLFAQTPYGLWVSDDHGESWTGVYVPYAEFELLFSVPRHICLAVPRKGFLFIHESDLELRLVPYPASFHSWDCITTNSRSIFFGNQQSGELWELDFEDAVLAAPHPRMPSAITDFAIEGVSPSPLHANGLAHVALSR